jgi:hypothetical protein
MGRYDALVNIEEKQEEVKPPAATSATPQTQSEQKDNEQQKEIKKPANPQTGKTANPLTRMPANPQFEYNSTEKPEKYTTRLIPVAPQLTVVTSTIARSGVAMLVKDAHAASVVPREAAAPEMTVVRASSSNAR